MRKIHPETAVLQPLGRNRWAATVAPVDHAASRVFDQTFSQKVCGQAFSQKVCVFDQTFFEKVCGESNKASLIN